MLSLASKAAAVYAENVHDRAVVDAVGDIERLTTIEPEDLAEDHAGRNRVEDARGAEVVSAGELSFSHQTKDG